MRIEGYLAREARSGAAGKGDVGSAQAQTPVPGPGPCSRQAGGEEPVFPPGEPRAPVPAPAEHAPHPPALLLQRRQGLGHAVPALPG